MNNLSEYKKSDFKRISWEEYGGDIESLRQKIEDYLKKNDIKIDAVVPILRGGSVLGSYLTYKLHLLKILPVQYKYFISKATGEHELKNLTKTSEEAFKISEHPTFLLVENNHCFGGASQQAANNLKKLVPGCKIIYVAYSMDCLNQKLDGAEIIFFGRLTNECRGLTKKEAEERGISNSLILFPWENLEEEWSAITNKEFFNDQD